MTSLYYQQEKNALENIQARRLMNTYEDMKSEIRKIMSLTCSPSTTAPNRIPKLQYNTEGYRCGTQVHNTENVITHEILEM